MIELVQPYLVTVYAKNEKDNLSAEEKNTVRKMIEFLEKEIKKKEVIE